MYVNMHGSDALAFKKGKWSEEEDEKLRAAVAEYGIQNWVAIEKSSGLGRPSKNCRLRWFNHLRPNLKKCPFTQEEERIILHLHHKYGNSWSLIASELPGRSDNEIKNYWNKRAKKCKKRHLPLYPPHTQEEHSPTNSPKSKNQNNDSYKTKNQGGNWLEDNFTPTNYATLAHSSISIDSPELQPTTVLNSKNTSSYPSVASITTSIGSPRTMVSLSTSEIQCPSLSPGQMSQPCPSPNIARQSTHVHALQQDGVGYKEFAPLRKPPTLASVTSRFREFRRDISQLSPQELSVSASKSAILNASELLPTDSSPQIHHFWPMESPRSPLKLNLSPRVSEQDPAEIRAINSQVSFSAVQLKSPTVPCSPLNLRLSIPGPLNPTIQSELSRLDSTVQLNSSTAATYLSSPQLKPTSFRDLDTTTPQLNAFDTYHFTAPDSSLQFYAPPIPETNSCISDVDTNSDAEILDALKQAQDRVQYLKKKLGQNRSPNKSFDESIVKDCLSPSSSKEEHVLERTLRSEERARGNSKTEVLLNKSTKMDNISCKLQKKVCSRKRKFAHEESTKKEELKQSENPGTKALLSEYSLKRNEHSLSESLNVKYLTNFPDQRHLIDLVDQPDNQNTTACSNTDSWDGKICHTQDSAAQCLNECSITEGLFTRSTEFSQEDHFMGDLWIRMSGIECPLDLQGQVPLASAFGQIYSEYENTATTLVKENRKLNYLMPDEGGFHCHASEQKFSDGMERVFTEQENLMDDNLAETAQFCESSLLLFQYPEANQLDSNCVLGKPLCKPGLYKSSLKTEDTSTETWKQEPSTDQSLEELLVETDRLEGSMVSHEQKFLTNVVNPTANPSTLTSLMEFNHGNSESLCGNTGVLKQEEEHSHMDTMPEELSSLLEFFPTIIHTPVWYKNNNEFNRGEAYNLSMNFGLNQD
ncbi:uncharacterized protein [Henckelia pumila]|uniref:uncharacterized protein n=1 Tax=Henckelia pumila TaxID=405737 RepID=UPI003C6E0E1F